MDVKEVAAYLRVTPEDVKHYVAKGLERPTDRAMVKLGATNVKGELVISDDHLDAFQEVFAGAEPGRRPPTWVMRKLSVEAEHRCGICRERLPLQFHHIMPWEKVKHYDPSAMMAVCGGCHDRIRRGEIDTKAQYQYKARLVSRTADVKQIDAQFQSAMATARAPELLRPLLDVLAPRNFSDADVQAAAHDYSVLGMAEKNALNQMSNEFFEVFVEEEVSHAAGIRQLFLDPANDSLKQRYLELVSDVRAKLTLFTGNGLGLDLAMLRLLDTLFEHADGRSPLERRALKSLVAFMYLSCDIGRKA